MAEHAPALAHVVSERLIELGLTGPAFDAAEIAAVYEAHMAMDASLDELIGAIDDDVALVFDPRNPS